MLEKRGILAHDPQVDSVKPNLAINIQPNINQRTRRQPSMPNRSMIFPYNIPPASRTMRITPLRD